jgi:hypothetical protein
VEAVANWVVGVVEEAAVVVIDGGQAVQAIIAILDGGGDVTISSLNGPGTSTSTATQSGITQ